MWGRPPSFNPRITPARPQPQTKSINKLRFPVTRGLENDQASIAYRLGRVSSKLLWETLEKLNFRHIHEYPWLSTLAQPAGRPASRPAGQAASQPAWLAGRSTGPARLAGRPVRSAGPAGRPTRPAGLVSRPVRPARPLLSTECSLYSVAVSKKTGDTVSATCGL